MSLSLEQVQHIANLARLELTEDELERYQKQLSAILDYFQQLEELDTDQIPSTESVCSEQTPLRMDQVRPGLALNELLQNAPDRGEGLFRVPPVFE